MKKLSFDVLEGFPLSTETLKYMQDAMKQLEGIGYLAGDNVILKGCEEAGGMVAAGIVFINGEVLPFEGGPVGTHVIIAQTATDKEFEGGIFNPYYLDRIAVFGSGAGEVAWADFKRNNHSNGVLARLDRVEKMLKPLIGYTADIGGVPTTVYGSWMFWGRPAIEIPDGWEAVPDAEWKGKVPVVFDDTDPDFNEVGKIGGSKTHQLTEQQMPIHKHNFAEIGDKDTDPVSTYRLVASNSDGPGGLNIDGKMKTAGGDLPHPNVQPYKVVLFIRFIG